MWLILLCFWAFGILKDFVVSEEKYYIAVDLGAESGRVMLSAVSGDKFSLEEIHRFGNGPVEENGALNWDF